MKNKLIFKVIGMVMVSLFAFASIGCNEDDPTVDVSGSVIVTDMPRQAPVNNVIARRPPTGTNTIVTWNASETTGGAQYVVYAQQEGKKTLITVGGTPVNATTFNDAGGSIPNNDVDLWSMNATTTASSVNFIVGQRYSFGVLTRSINNGMADSIIVWSNYVQY